MELVQAKPKSKRRVRRKLKLNEQIPSEIKLSSNEIEDVSSAPKNNESDITVIPVNNLEAEVRDNENTDNLKHSNEITAGSSSLSTPNLPDPPKPEQELCKVTKKNEVDIGKDKELKPQASCSEAKASVAKFPLLDSNSVPSEEKVVIEDNGESNIQGLPESPTCDHDHTGTKIQEVSFNQDKVEFALNQAKKLDVPVKDTVPIEFNDLRTKIVPETSNLPETLAEPEVEKNSACGSPTTSSHEEVDEPALVIMKAGESAHPDDQSVLDLELAHLQDQFSLPLPSSEKSHEFLHPSLSFDPIGVTQVPKLGIPNVPNLPSCSKEAEKALEFSRVFGLPVCYPPPSGEEVKSNTNNKTWELQHGQEVTSANRRRVPDMEDVLSHIPPFQSNFKLPLYGHKARNSKAKGTHGAEAVPLQVSWTDLTEEFGLNTNVDEDAGVLIEYYQMTMKESMLPERNQRATSSNAKGRVTQVSQVTLGEGANAEQESALSPSMKNLYSGTSLLRRSERSRGYTMPVACPKPEDAALQNYYKQLLGQVSTNQTKVPAKVHARLPCQSPPALASSAYFALMVDPTATSLFTGPSIETPEPNLSTEQKKGPQMQWVAKLKSKTQTAFSRARASLRSVFRKRSVPETNVTDDVNLNRALAPLATFPRGNTHNSKIKIPPSVVNNGAYKALNKFESIANVDYINVMRNHEHSWR